MVSIGELRDKRIVVQPGRTLRSGRRGRWFESSQSDQDTKTAFMAVFLCLECDSMELEPARSWFDHKRKRDESIAVAVKAMSAGATK